MFSVYDVVNQLILSAMYAISISSDSVTSMNPQSASSSHFIVFVHVDIVVVSSHVVKEFSMK